LIEQELADKRLARSALPGDQSERSLEVDREHHVSESVGMTLGTIEEPWLNAVSEGILAKSVELQKVGCD
jgi:hypothetical protein